MIKYYRLLKGGTWYLNRISILGIKINVWSRKKRFDKEGNSLTIKKEKYL